MRYKTTTQECIYLIAIALYLCAVLGAMTMLIENSICALCFTGMRYLAYLLALIKVLRDGFYTKQFFPIFIVFACVACTVLFSEEKTFGFYFLLILAAKDMNMYKIIKLGCCIQGAYIALCVLLSQIGIITDVIFDPNVRARHGLGFTWTTTPPILFFFFIMSYIYLRREKMHTVEYLILELLNCWFFVMTDARMSFYLSSVALLFFAVMRYYWKNHDGSRFLNWLLIFSPIIMCGIALILHAGYNSANETWNALNSLLSGRLELGSKGIQEYGITLFGQPIQWIGFGFGAAAGTYNYVDCSYMQILLQNGVVILGVVLLIYIYIMYMAVRVKDFFLQTIILVILVFSITEPRLMNLGYNIFPLLAAGFFSSANVEKLFRKGSGFWPHIRWSSLHVSVKKRR